MPRGGVALISQKLIYSIFIVSVNVFVLISGYFLVSSKIKLKKLLILWIQVWLYSIITYLIASLAINDNFNTEDFLYSVLPIISNKYWFFTAYFLLMLCVNFLNKILNNSNKKELTLMSAGILIIIYFATRAGIGNVVSLSAGYSFLWFLMLYLIGGYFRLYPPEIKKIWIFLIYCVCTLALWGMAFMPTENFFALIIYNSMDYISPLALITSICMLLLFRNMHVKNNFVNKIICFISSCTFGIYLFQESHIKPRLYFNILQVQNQYGSAYSALWVLVFSLALFAMGFAVEIVRKAIMKIIDVVYVKVKKAKNKDIGDC